MTTKFTPKIALVGSGMIGGTVGLLCSLKELSSDVVFLDVVDDMPAGKALDLSQALAADNMTPRIQGCTGIGPNAAGLKDADVVIVTAGFPRKPGMTRDDLLSKNAEVITNVGEALKTLCPNAFVVCITNPLDIMVALLQKVSGIPTSRVVGMAGLLDSARFQFFLGEELKVSPQSIQTLVLGGHGDEMVPLVSATSVGGIPLKTLIKAGHISESRVTEIVERTRQGGGEIVALLKQGSAYVAPAVCATKMVKAYLKDEKKVMPCCAYVKGQYNLDGSYAGVPCVIGKGGVERIIEIPFEGAEAEMFKKSMSCLAESRETCKRLGFSI